MRNKHTMHPPATDDIDKLAEFFDNVDATAMGGLEEVRRLPERELVNVSIRLSKRDLDIVKSAADQEGLAPSALMRWVLHRFVRAVDRVE